MAKWLTALSLTLGGCSLLPVHQVDVSSELQKNPVQEVVIAQPQFPKKFRVSRPGIDFLDMLPENRPATAKTVISAFGQMLGEKAAVEWPLIEDSDWAVRIVNRMNTFGIPDRTEPNPNLKSPAVLLIFVDRYGYSDAQYLMTGALLLGKEYRFGPTKWYHECQLLAILVRPSDGKILMWTEHKESLPDLEKLKKSPFPNVKDPALLDQALRNTIKVFVDAFPTAAP